MSTIDEAALEAAGYRKYPAGHKGEFCTGLWQKWVRDDSAKLYAVNVYTWNFSGVLAKEANDSGAMSTSVEVWLYPRGGPSVQLCPMTDGMSLEEVEAFIAMSYKALDCEPDRLNN